uniref:NADH-ubiquinone oxidoreductase chain 4L n=1 Tax=Vulcanolepas fijiensis TaxID=2511776 RepID=A0A649YDR9_9CRUS|nr:NADH dehydrogenase subunit 4L [Vulcanolepas fijiensis]YP_010490392.1 NADH dehydrogenase subunit 4L [Leucolepas longa]QGL53227.1 NADH dehydrogenase subunit 4L [Vulcanolepas fijiensis]UWM12878.1 NADH dehydrogenase subunit 4L [Leucolepas longa]
MLSNFLYLPVFLFLVGFWMYISKRKHLMSMLISLEYVVLSIFFFLILVSVVMGFEVYLSLVFLVASVCEGSLGVSILVGMVRSYSSDYLSVLSVLKC